MSTNGGETWNLQMSDTFGNSPAGISCATQITCFAVGSDDVQTCEGEDACYSTVHLILATTNGGEAWNQQRHAGSFTLVDVACPGTTHCSAVGDNGAILTTENGGRVWSVQRSGTTQNLLGIACPSMTSCYAVGDQGGILTTRQ